MSFKNVEKQVDFSKVEEKILKFWKENKTFKKSLEKTKNKEHFVFYDGPPFATGLPHYGHILPGTIKDIIPRYHTMKGKYVERIWGWDCHGLPVENLIEQELGLKSKKELLDYGIDKFNEACRNSVLKYTSEWEKAIDRMGRWVDFENAYKTMDPDYMESIWWVFKSLWEKGLIYEGFKILPYCYRCTTPLSNFETNQGYKDTQDPAITVTFQLKDDPDSYILAWTTTPWTLPSNMGLAVGKDIEYVKVRDESKNYILAEELLPKYYKDPSSINIIEKFKGKKLIGKKYIPLFPYFPELEKEGAFTIVDGHHVSTESGTGVVHIAPGFGEDDAEIGKKEGLPAVCPVDDEGRFTEEITDFAGRNVKEADKDIIKKLKEENKILKHETYQHSYPHCWRCDEPLIYKSITSWFVNVQKIKETMISSNKKINWFPDHIKDGRFGKWIEGARDWAISRNRYWGCPIPVWKCDNCDETVCIGSIEELESLSRQKIDDLHKHLIDPVTFSCKKCDGTMTRIEEVLDCWFESGAMPYAQSHYPFDNKTKFEDTYPADFIAESLDQTRGWFYTLLVLGAALFDKSPYQNVVVSGLILAEDGQKMSKRLKNYPEVNYIFHKYGADAVRIYLMLSGAVKAGELLFSESGVAEVIRSFHLPLWNAYSFFITYAIVDKWSPDNIDNNLENPLDKWLISYSERLVGEINNLLGNYDIQNAIKTIYQYLNGLTNWYIRRSRRRFWKSENDTDKNQAYSALYLSLINLCKVTAPIAPFLVEEIYQNLRTDDMPDSVHLCDFPIENKKLRDPELEKEMDLIIRTVEMGRSLRANVQINLRKPLNAVHLVTKDKEEKKLLSKMEDIIKEELNVKNVIFEEEEEKLVTLSAKPNFKVLGKKVGNKMKAVAQVINNFGKEELSKIENDQNINIKVDGEEIELTNEDVLIERNEKEGLSVINLGSLTIALDTNLTQDLIEEGIARQFIRHVQNLRKNKDLNVTDRINVFYEAPENISLALNNWADSIKQETLAIELKHDNKADVEANVDDTKIMIGLNKA